MDYIPKWRSARELMERWDTKLEQSIIDAIEAGLPVYEETPDIGIIALDPVEAVARLCFSAQGWSPPLEFHRLRFKLKDIVQFDSDNPDRFSKPINLIRPRSKPMVVAQLKSKKQEIFSNPTFDENKQAEYMRLKKANKRLALIAEAAPHMAYFVAGRFEKDGTRTTKKEFCAEGLKNFPNLSRNYFEVALWKTVPKRYKHLNNTDDSDS